MEANGDVKKSRPPLGDIGNTHVQKSGDTLLSPEEDMKDLKFKVDVLQGALECEAKFNVVNEQRLKKNLATLKEKDEALKTKDEEMRKMKEDLEAKEMAALAKDEEMKAKDEEMKANIEEIKANIEEVRKVKADLEAANRGKEMDKASLKVKDEVLEEVAAGLKNSDMDQVTAAAIRALFASLERTKKERDQMEQERDAALRGRKRALAQRDDAEMRFQDAEMRFQDAEMRHLDDMGRLLKG